MGRWERSALAFLERTLGYHPCDIGILTCASESRRGTLSGGQFDWGGRLLKSSGGVQRFVRSRHYFPSVNLDELNDEEFAMLSEDAVWLHSKMLITQQASALGMLA